MTTYSQDLRLSLIADGTQVGTWGDTTNANLGTLIEQAIAGVSGGPSTTGTYPSITMPSDDNYALTANNGAVDQARNAVIVINSTPTLSQTRYIIAPAGASKVYIVKNSTSGSQAIAMSYGTTSAPTGAAVSVANGTTSIVYGDGTNFYGVSASGGGGGGSSIAINEQAFVATAGQTVFNLTSFSYTPGINSLQVYVNGLKQVLGEAYTETSTTSFTFVTGLNDGAIVEALGGAALAQSISALNVAYNEGGTGAVTTTVQAKLQQYVSVKDFGAVGDGTTDDTAAIQAAYNAVNTSTGSKGVFFPSGTYLISSTINCTPNYGTTVPQLLGEGADTTKIVAKSGFGANPLFTHTGSSPSKNSKWQGVSISGTSAADGQWGIHHVNTCFVNYDGIYFSELECAVRFENQGGGFTEQNVLTNCWCANSYYFITFARQVGSTQDSFRGTGLASECHMDLTTYTQARMMRVYYVNSLACNCYNTPLNGSIWIGSAQAVMQNDGPTPIRATGTLRYETSANPWTFGTGSALCTDYFTGVLVGLAYNPVGNTCNLEGLINQSMLNQTGTFTPVLTASGGSLSTSYAVAGQQGYFSVNGKVCTFQIFLNVTSASGGTGNVGIDGFPFLPATLPISGGVSPVSFTPIYPTGITYTNQLLLGAVPSNTYQLIYTAPSAGSLTNFQWSSMPSSFSMRIYGSYIIA